MILFGTAWQTMSCWQLSGIALALEARSTARMILFAIALALAARQKSIQKQMMKPTCVLRRLKLYKSSKNIYAFLQVQSLHHNQQDFGGYCDIGNR